ncbi:hypothetical protein BH24ACI3_BH24ACI3_04930 [soil metagenome]
MKGMYLSLLIISSLLFAACGDTADGNHANHDGNANAAPAGPVTLTDAEVPQRIKDMMAARGEQDASAPEIEISFPADGSTVESSTVRIGLTLGGDLKGYKPGMDDATKMGNHIHVILDNQAYEAYYNIEEPFELRNVPDGEHTLRVFASRPWHESYKNEGAFDVVKFTVKNGDADLDLPATTNSGQQISNENAAANATAKPTPEGKEMPASTGGAIDVTKPLLTYSRPKGEYKGDDADPIMIDFWLANAQLVGDGGEYRVRYSVNGGEPKMIEKWAPLWLSGWTAGKHTITLELIDKEGNVVDNGGYNSTTRDITVVK